MLFSEFQISLWRLNKIHIRLGCFPPSEGGDCRRRWIHPSLPVTECSDRLSSHNNGSDAREHNTWINWQINLYSALCSMSSLSLSLGLFPSPFFSLPRCTLPSHSLHHNAKTHINHWSMQLIFPPTCQEKEWERHRPHPGSVYLCYYHRINCEAFPFLFSLHRNLRTQWKEIENGMFVSLPARATEALENTLTLPLTSCLRHLR